MVEPLRGAAFSLSAPTSARPAASTTATCSAKPCFRAERPSGLLYRAPTRSPDRSDRRRLYRLFPGSRVGSAERCVVANCWPDCGRFASFSVGRVAAPNNYSPCRLFTFVFPTLPHENVPTATHPSILPDQLPP